MDTYTCPRCQRSFNSYDSLRRHAGRVHKIDSVEFRVEYYHDGKWPTCKCGCGKWVKWSAGGKCFREYVAGHQSRVHNNWGHNPKAIEKSAQTRREQFASGERQVWNVGLTTKTDVRVKENGRAVSESIMNDPSEIQRRSDHMSQQWKTENIVPQCGPDHPNWKGGISPVNLMCRADRRLYTEWTYPILVRDGFKCTKCGSTKDLQVHHNEITFAEILKKLITLEDLEKQEDYERKKIICEKVTNFHLDNKVSGVTLCFDCHEEIHPSLNL